MPLSSHSPHHQSLQPPFHPRSSLSPSLPRAPRPPFASFPLPFKPKPHHSSPNVLSMASSLKDESSYSYLTDMDGVGLSLIDRFTWSTLDFFEKVDINSHLTLGDLVKIYK